MRKVLVLLLMFLCTGCMTHNEQIIPIVSNVQLKPSKIQTYEGAKLSDVYSTIEYRFTLEPYNLVGKSDSAATIGVWLDFRLINYCLKEKDGSFRTGDMFITQTIPMRSETPITVSVHDIFSELDVEDLEDIISLLKEVKYSIRVDNETVDTQVIQISE